MPPAPTPAFAPALSVHAVRPSLGAPVCRARRAQVARAPASQRHAARVVTMKTPVGTDPMDVMLGEFAFTEPDQLPMLVAEKVAEGSLSEEFYTYVQAKIDASADLEERETLRMLSAAVQQLEKELKEGGPAAAAIAEGQGGGVFETVDAAEVATATYDALIERLVEASKEHDGAVALAANVEFSYEEIDKRFLDRLAEQAKLAGINGEEEKAKSLKLVEEAIASAMSKKVGEAAEKLKTVVSAGSPDDMRKEISRINTMQGGIDDAFVLLLQGNIQQAEAAGQEPAVKILTMLMEFASSLKEARLNPEVRLIRKLIRAPDSAARIEMLTEALSPNKSVLLADGTKTSGVRVNGKKFVEALRELIEQYSNIEEKFAMQLSTIGEESEEIARKLFDMEDKDVKDLQNEAFHKRSVSVWDLEEFEQKEDVEGRKAPWDGRLGNIPEGFDEHGKMAI